MGSKRHPDERPKWYDFSVADKVMDTAKCAGLVTPIYIGVVYAVNHFISKKYDALYDIVADPFVWVSIAGLTAANTVWEATHLHFYKKGENMCTKPMDPL